MAEPISLTDAELAEELASFGEEIPLPIKPNKRPILIKKLNHLRARFKAQEAPPPKPKGRGKSKQISKPALPPQTPTNDSYLDNGRRTSAGRLSPSRSSQRTNRSDDVSSLRNLDTFSSDDSDVETIPSYLSRSQTQPKHTPPAPGSPGVRNTRDRKRELPVPDNVLRTLRRRTGDALPRRTRRSEAYEVAADQSDVSNAPDGSHSEDEIAVPSPARSRLYPDLSRFSSIFSREKENEIKFESSDEDVDGSVNASTYEVENKSVNTSFPFLNNSQHAGTSFSHRNISPDSSFGSFSNSPGISTQGYRRIQRQANGHPRVQQYKSWYLESLPQLLVFITALFFAGLAVFYIATHKDFFISWFSTSSNMGSGDNILMCKDGVPKEGCYVKEEIDKALVNVESLFQYLSDRKGKVLCDAAKPGDDVASVAVLKSQIYAKSVAKTNSERLYECCVEHILANPHWNLRALRADGTLATRVAEVVQLESSVAHMSLWCRLCRSFTQVLYGLFVIAFVVLCVFLGSLYLKHKLKQREAEQREVYTMVEKIIDVLQDHDEQNKSEDSDEPPYLAVQHVRDQLLPPSQRRRLQPIWHKAVEFIARYESRIRAETRMIHGEEFEVWHWLQPSVHNGKIWQGQAFGESNGNNSNQVIYSPTPCLKIRNMFDSNVESEDGWEESVTDAILEKTRHIGNILHIYVDVDSREGCVYLKCSDNTIAGRVRLALHGWWFDGRLVTVKHLKTDHYHKRWPESRNATVPRKPSSDQMKSLSQPFYRSSLEMT